jgi:hypothetical protein
MNSHRKRIYIPRYHVYLLDGMVDKDFVVDGKVTPLKESTKIELHRWSISVGLDPKVFSGRLLSCLWNLR